jgi:hypothetical protein
MSSVVIETFILNLFSFLYKPIDGVLYGAALGRYDESKPTVVLNCHGFNKVSVNSFLL